MLRSMWIITGLPERELGQWELDGRIRIAVAALCSAGLPRAVERTKLGVLPSRMTPRFVGADFAGAPWKFSTSDIFLRWICALCSMTRREPGRACSPGITTDRRR